MNKYLSIGKKLPNKVSSLSEGEKEEIREALQEDEDFIEFVDQTLEWTDEEHDNLKNILELPKNENGYYKDAYGQRISYNGIRTLKRAKTEINLSKMHKNEIEKCKNDFKYFRKHYCLITTKLGLARPELRNYQDSLEDELTTLDDVVILYPRQSGKCAAKNTNITVRNDETGEIQEMTMEEFHIKIKEESEEIIPEFVEIKDINEIE